MNLKGVYIENSDSAQIDFGISPRNRDTKAQAESASGLPGQLVHGRVNALELLVDDGLLVDGMDHRLSVGLATPTYSHDLKARL